MKLLNLKLKPNEQQNDTPRCPMHRSIFYGQN